MTDVTERLSEQFRLTEDEKKELLPSGQTFIFGSRVGWARTYFKKAGLIDSTKRGTITITQRGLVLLQSNPSSINVKTLKQFPEFVEFHTQKKESAVLKEDSFGELSEKETPEDTLGNAYLKIRSALAQEIINKVVSLSPNYFERLVIELLVRMGYGGSLKEAGRVVGKSGDEGIDGTINEDKLGLDIIYIQAKRWRPGNIVGRPQLQQFVGALAGQGAKKGIFITTSSFTKDAQKYTPKNETKIVLIDGEQLAEYMIDYNIGVTLKDTYEVKRIDDGYFGEE